MDGWHYYQSKRGGGSWMGRFLCTREVFHAHIKNPLKRVGKVRLYLAWGATKLRLSDWRALRCRKRKRDS